MQLLVNVSLVLKFISGDAVINSILGTCNTPCHMVHPGSSHITTYTITQRVSTTPMMSFMEAIAISSKLHHQALCQPHT